MNDNIKSNMPIDIDINNNYSMIEVELIKELKSLTKGGSSKNLNLFINNKQISSEIFSLRLAILDWMCEVAYKIEISSNTLLRGIEIFDETIYCFDYNLSLDDFHLISIVSLILAYKFEERKTISLKQVSDKICFGKFTDRDLIRTEIIVLKKLKFIIPQNKFETILNLIINKFASETDFASESTDFFKNLEFFSYLIFFLAKLDINLLRCVDNQAFLVTIIYSSIFYLEREGVPVPDRMNSYNFLKFIDHLGCISIKNVLKLSHNIDKIFSQYIKMKTRKEKQEVRFIKNQILNKVKNFR
jgi:hypothetical protein